MRVQIAMLSGAVHVHELFAIFGLTACTMLFGWLMETLNGDRLTTYTELDEENKVSGLAAQRQHFFNSC